MIYGNDPEVAQSAYHKGHVIGKVEVSSAGNIILRAGVTNEGGLRTGWHQTLHIVLTPDEARETVREINRNLT
jgi:hypothetical protein